MKRTLEFTPGGFYHIYNRGANRNSIFRDEENYFYVLGKMKEYARKYEISILAYCLLPNHYHFLVRQDSEHPARLLPQFIYNAYTKAFNKRFERSGTLFEGPFRALQVHTEPYLLNLCRYIHANPVLHGIVDDPGMWQFSNYLEWVGQRKGTLVDRTFVTAYFETDSAYERFVLEYLRERELPQPLAEYLQDLDV
ncbi:MAG: transposase [Caldilineales bacterium]|nr:transposase [Caldilineales bacterium]